VRDDIVTLKAEKGGDLSLPLDVANRFTVYQPETRAFAVGDVVRCVEQGTTTNGKKLQKGSFHKVTGFTADGEIQLGHDRVVPSSYRFLDHGYATTSVSSQGLTVDTVLVSLNRDSIPAVSREQFYVSVSRGRRDVRLYIDDATLIRQAVAETSRTPTARDLADGTMRAEQTREARMAEWRQRLKRRAVQMAQEKGGAVKLDAQFMREASRQAMREYHGRVRDHAAELGQ